MVHLVLTDAEAKRLREHVATGPRDRQLGSVRRKLSYESDLAAAKANLDGTPERFRAYLEVAFRG